jgi:hypothetical protein
MQLLNPFSIVELMLCSTQRLKSGIGVSGYFDKNLCAYRKIIYFELHIQGCKKFCVNGHVAGNCAIARSNNNYRQKAVLECSNCVGYEQQFLSI